MLVRKSSRECDSGVIRKVFTEGSSGHGKSSTATDGTSGKSGEDGSGATQHAAGEGGLVAICVWRSPSSGLLEQSYLDANGLREMLVRSPDTCVLSKAVRARRDHYDIVNVCWTPEIFRIEHRVNIHLLSHDAIPLAQRCDVQSPSLYREVACSPLITRMIFNQVCDFVSLVHNMEKKSIFDFQATFRVDHRGRVWLLWVDICRFKPVSILPKFASAHKGSATASSATSHTRRSLRGSKRALPLEDNGNTRGAGAEAATLAAASLLKIHDVDPIAGPGAALWSHIESEVDQRKSLERRKSLSASIFGIGPVQRRGAEDDVAKLDRLEKSHYGRHPSFVKVVDVDDLDAATAAVVERRLTQILDQAKKGSGGGGASVNKGTTPTKKKRVLGGVATGSGSSSRSLTPALDESTLARCASPAVQASVFRGSTFEAPCDGLRPMVPLSLLPDRPMTSFASLGSSVWSSHAGMPPRTAASQPRGDSLPFSHIPFVHESSAAHPSPPQTAAHQMPAFSSLPTSPKAAGVAVGGVAGDSSMSTNSFGAFSFDVRPATAGGTGFPAVSDSFSPKGFVGAQRNLAGGNVDPNAPQVPSPTAASVSPPKGSAIVSFKAFAFDDAVAPPQQTDLPAVAGDERGAAAKHDEDPQQPVALEPQASLQSRRKSFTKIAVRDSAAAGNPSKWMRSVQNVHRANSMLFQTGSGSFHPDEEPSQRRGSNTNASKKHREDDIVGSDDEKSEQDGSDEDVFDSSSDFSESPKAWASSSGRAARTSRGNSFQDGAFKRRSNGNSSGAKSRRQSSVTFGGGSTGDVSDDREERQRLAALQQRRREESAVRKFVPESKRERRARASVVLRDKADLLDIEQRLRYNDLKRSHETVVNDVVDLLYYCQSCVMKSRDAVPITFDLPANCPPISDERMRSMGFSVTKDDEELRRVVSEPYYIVAHRLHLPWAFDHLKATVEDLCHLEEMEFWTKLSSATPSAKPQHHRHDHPHPHPHSVASEEEEGDDDM